MRSYSTRESNTESPTPLVVTLSAKASASLVSTALSTPSYSIGPKDKIRTSWVFNYMLDAGKQTKYFNITIRVEE
jgi:hypothetical protein